MVSFPVKRRRLVRLAKMRNPSDPSEQLLEDILQKSLEHQETHQVNAPQIREQEIAQVLKNIGPFLTMRKTQVVQNSHL